MWPKALAVAAASLIAAGCGGGGTSSTEKPGPESLRVTVIGDSMINPKNGCQGCTGFVEQFTDHVKDTLGTKAKYSTIPAGGVPEALEAVSRPGPDADLVSDSDVVVVQVGANNALPDPETGIGCKTWFLNTRPACLAEGVATYGDLYDQIFAAVKALRGDRPTVYVAVNSVDGNLVPASDFPDGLLSLYPNQKKQITDWAVGAYDRWNTMLAASADAAGFELVDVYHRFNGADGSATYWPELSEDGTHPNQAGNDSISKALAEVDLSAVSHS